MAGAVALVATLVVISAPGPTRAHTSGPGRGRGVGSRCAPASGALRRPASPAGEDARDADGEPRTTGAACPARRGTGARPAPPAEVRELGTACRAGARRCEARAEGHRPGRRRLLGDVSPHVPVHWRKPDNSRKAAEGTQSPGSSTIGRSVFLSLHPILRPRQPLRQDPHKLRGCRSSHLRPRIRQVVLHGRVRQAEAMRGRLLRPGGKHGRNNHDLAVGGALGGVGEVVSSCAPEPVGRLRRLGEPHRDRMVVGGGANSLAPTKPTSSVT